MAAKKALDTTTEEKIKNAARQVFHQKGFAATRTRDIAEAANINLALLNYYFRSKENLFSMVMLETMHSFFNTISTVMRNESTSLDEKIEGLASSYIDMLLVNPNIPMFLMHEIKSQPDDFVKKMGAKEMIHGSSFMHQFQAEVQKGNFANVHPFQFIMNLMGMMLFPFIASPLLKGIGDMSDEQFEALMQQRKQLIPIWVKATLKA